MPAKFDDWKMASWGAAVALRNGRAFGFLAWYQLIKLADPQSETPTVDLLTDPTFTWHVTYPGSCPSNRFKRMQLTKLGKLELDEQRVNALLAESKIVADKIEDCAIEDVCISNALNVHTCTHQPSIRGLRTLIN